MRLGKIFFKRISLHLLSLLLLIPSGLRLIPSGLLLIPSGLLLIPLVVACEGRGIRSITSKELKDHANYLASDELGGRMTGEPGTRMAEEYIARQFEEFELSPLPGKDNFFLDFDLFEYGYDPEKTYLEADAEGVVHRARPGIDFKPFFSQTQARQKPLSSSPDTVSQLPNTNTTIMKGSMCPARSFFYCDMNPARRIRRVLSTDPSTHVMPILSPRHETLPAMVRWE